MKITVDTTDLEKIEDTLGVVHTFMQRRDEMNAAVHLAENVRYSPITSNVQASLERLGQILVEARSEG